jgi:hypothetical protein
MWYKRSAKSPPFSFCFNLKMETRFKIALEKMMCMFFEKIQKTLEICRNFNLGLETRTRACKVAGQKGNLGRHIACSYECQRV